MDGNSGIKGPSSAFESPTFDENASFRLDKPVGSASISPCGRDIVLASRQGLHIIDLDSPWSPPRHLPHNTPWEVADVQWSPFAARDYWVVSTSNQKALVWNLAMINPQASIEHYLHAHSRAITDINFSAHHPDILATCAVDSYVHCWDLRHPSRAAFTFCDWFAGATQVKWNRQDPHILASSHDKFLRIWDDRKGAYPLRSIEAHATKIYGVDWNRIETNKVATCSLDKTIKFWDYASDSDKPVRTIQTPFPVWRARHTPFGAGLLAMPQRGDYDLHLYDRQEGDQTQLLNPMPLVHRFDGHEGQVKEFLWRSRGSVEDSKDSREFQLISWGTDRMLRLHRVDEEVLGKVGYVRGQQVRRTIPFTRRNAEYKSFRGYPKKSTSNTGDTTGERHFQMDIQSSAGMTGAGIGRQSLRVGGVWATEENPHASMDGKKPSLRDDVDAISWMKGVKIGKRDKLPTGMEQSESSILSTSLKTGHPWDTFDSLAEEITHLADTFSKVTFEDINMHDRQIVVSLHGPFGSEKASVYIRCKIDVPIGYPDEEPVWPIIESTAGTSDEYILRAMSDLQNVAQAYQERHRHSLEAVLRYLLGEQSCDESLALLRMQSDHAELEPDQQLELSSSDEEDGEDEYTNNHVHGLESSEGILAVSNAQYNVPLPKACGALWADDGRLVCFFPPKDEKRYSLIEPLGVNDGGWNFKNHNTLFEGFGRMQSRSNTTGRTLSNPETIESGDSDFEDSSRSSSGSSSSSNFGMMAPLKLIPSIAWREGPPEAHHVLSADESQKSSGANARTTSASRISKNYISIRQCSNLLPSKRHLAEAYSLETNSQCCLHNATVARENGELDLADTWDFVNLILKDEVPLEQAHIGSQHEPILMIARRTLSPLRAKDSAIDLSYDEDSHQKIKGRTYWGSHPFGRRWLVDSLFAHFEKIADIQMLAMLSCVLQQSSNANMPLPDDLPKSHGSHPLAGFDRYFPTLEVASSMLLPLARNPAFTLEMRKSGSDPHSAASSFGASTSDPLTPFSTGVTPPSSFKANKSKHERTFSQAPLSASPEQLKHVHRSSSNLASAFAASIARPFSFSTPDSSSPPLTQTKRRPSPGPNHLSAESTNLPWSLSATSGQTSITTRPQKSRLTSTDEQSQSSQLFSTELKHQDQFENDGYSADLLLDPEKEEQYSAYRAMYASMLLTWELPIASCKVLQYNKSLPNSKEPTSRREQGGAQSLISVGRNISNTTEVDPANLRLDICNICDNCRVALPTGTSSKRCSACSRSQVPVLCQLCHCIISGLSSPCLNCGHVLHLSCRSSIQQAEDVDVVGECVTGCGCFCADHLIINVQTPMPSDHRRPSIGAPYLFANEQEELGWRDSSEEIEAAESETWEDVAYESLARNLGGRFLTPKPSQIWRGGETRTGSFSGFSKLRRSESG